jgi:signal transduction histidine kinase
MIDNVQKITARLRPLILDELGLIPALHWKVKNFEELTGLTVVFQCSQDFPNVPLDLATTVFRILQEALTNVARHAQAAQVWVSLIQQNDCLVLIIRDDGVGVDPSDLKRPSSFGLVSIRERAMGWGGKAEIMSSPRHGTSVIVKLPFVKPQRAAAL